jgi:hypothetical protein
VHERADEHYSLSAAAFNGDVAHEEDSSDVTCLESSYSDNSYSTYALLGQTLIVDQSMAENGFDL